MGNWGHAHQCTRWAVTTQQGTPLCKQHHPDAEKARQAASAARWNAKFQAVEWRGLLIDAGRAVRDFKGDLPKTLDALRKRLRAKIPDSTP